MLKAALIGVGAMGSGHLNNYHRLMSEGKGVKLVATGSACQKELEELSAIGVSLIACRTCLDYYGLLDKVVVGEVGNMMRIVEAQASADKVITL